MAAKKHGGGQLFQYPTSLPETSQHQGSGRLQAFSVIGGKSRQGDASKRPRVEEEEEEDLESEKGTQAFSTARDEYVCIKCDPLPYRVCDM